ncbi:hypothetical protein ACRRJ4_005121, partial [Escherichia coli]
KDRSTQQNIRVMKGAARERGPFQRHRRAVFSRRGQTGIYPPACPASSGPQTNNHLGARV